MKEPIAVISIINISVFQLLNAFSVLHPLLDNPFIFISLFVGQDSVTLRLVIVPFSNVRLPFSAFPNARALLPAAHPLALIRLSSFPDMLADALGSIHLESSVIG